MDAAPSKQHSSLIYVYAFAAMGAIAAAAGFFLFGGSAGEDAADPVSGASGGGIASFAEVSDPEAYGGLGFQRPDGSQVTLADFGDKVVLLNLWATWCAPCVAELPTLDALQAAEGDDGFEVVALSLDRAGPEAAAAFLNELGVDNLTGFNDASMKAGLAFDMVGLPVTILLDKDKKEIGRVTGPAEWDSEEAVALVRKYSAD